MQIINELLTKGKEQGRPGGRLTPKGIVVHYVGNPGSTALANRNYFERGSDGRGVASHYIIGLSGEILQCVPEDEIAIHGNAANSTHIGIENCHPDTAGKFNDKTYQSLVELAADICKRYKLNPLKDVIRHYDVNGKDCPLYYVKNESAWDKLKQDIFYKSIDTSKLTPIMGKSKLTIEQFMKYRATWKEMPKLTNGNFSALVDLYYKIAAIEGVRADIALCQSFNETGFYQYKGIVQPNQNNFAGLGAFDDNKKGICNVFPNVEKGVIAHVQHLKGYASNEPLKLPCEDMRYNDIKVKGSSPYLEWLSIPNNPATTATFRVGWASDEKYFSKIMKIYEDVKKV